MGETMKEILLKIDSLLDAEFQTKDALIPNNITLIYEIIEEELDYIERMEVKWARNYIG